MVRSPLDIPCHAPVMPSVEGCPPTLAVSLLCRQPMPRSSRGRRSPRPLSGPQPRERESPARLPNGLDMLPERTPRPDRPRARDRPKPRRRPRPQDPNAPPGETRRSRSAPAQTSAPPPLPPTHTVQQEGYLLRKLELEGPNKKASNR